jgi:Rps23 Pro-64 3,4-dihydroxylase Tpa1-like proline 4-hydroxylase
MIEALVPRCFDAFGIDRFAPDHYELHVTASYHGDFYTAHRDYVPEHDNQVQTRRITYVYYFRAPGGGFEEGHLRLYDWQGADGAASRQRFTTILPKDNRLVLFPSHALHEICKVKAPSGRVEDGRFTLNGWVHRAKASKG